MAENYWNVSSANKRLPVIQFLWLQNRIRLVGYFRNLLLKFLKSNPFCSNLSLIFAYQPRYPAPTVDSSLNILFWSVPCCVFFSSGVDYVEIHEKFICSHWMPFKALTGDRILASLAHPFLRASALKRTNVWYWQAPDSSASVGIPRNGFREKRWKGKGEISGTVTSP